MEQKERVKRMKAALVDFLFQGHQIPHLVSVVVFGSLLEGDVSKKSDIDVLLVFDTDYNPETSKESDIVSKLAGKITDAYDLENPIRALLISRRNFSDVDAEFLKKVAKEGVVVWRRGMGIEPFEHPEFEPFFLFSYSTKGMALNTKRTFLRKVKRFIKKHGRKVGGGAVLVEAKHASEFEEICQKAETKWTKLSVFV